MSYLVVLCEGETEMDFVQQVLSDHLIINGTTCHPIKFGKKVMHDIATAPGGIFKYDPVFKHINASLRQYSAPTSYVTTMMDFYAFPRDFPEYEELAKEPEAAKRVALFEEKMFNHIGREERFLPYIQLREFEALIYARLEEFRAEFADDQEALKGLDRLIEDVQGLAPEEINQTKVGAPSKRLLAALPYDKRSGARLVQQIGLQVLKEACPHFGAWLSRLENLGGIP